MQVNTCMRVRKEKKNMVYFVVTTYYDEEKDKEDYLLSRYRRNSV